MDLQIEVTCDSIPASARALGYRSEEVVSAPFALRLGLRAPLRDEIDLDALIGQSISLSTTSGVGSAATAGRVESAEIVHVAGDGVLYALTIVPRLAKLAGGEHSRVFVDQSVPDVVRAVLALEGLSGDAVRFELRASYERREHVCQYRESSLAFVRRLVQREGILFAFEHVEGRDVVVFRDDVAAAPLCPTPLTWGPEAAHRAAVLDKPLVVALAAKRSVVPTAVRVHDHEPLTPSLHLEGRERVAAVGEGREHVEWAPNTTKTATAAARARILGEALRGRAKVYRGAATSPELRAGTRFQIAEHPVAALSQGYFVARVTHTVIAASASASERALFGWSADLGGAADAESSGAHACSAQFEAYADSAPFRTSAALSEARVDGLVDAWVDGPAESEYAQIDAHGRYHVRVRFDEQAGAAGGASMWVRMLQPHGGSLEGMHFPLRKGTEVHLLFLGGDPDRPVIAGVAPNLEKKSPVASFNASQNVVQTGGKNRLEIEDARGGQYLTMSSPTAASHLHLGAGAYQLALRTEGQGHVETGQSLEVEVLGPKTESVASDVTETYQASHTLEVGGAFTETRGAALTRQVLGPITTAITGTLVETVKCAAVELYQSGLSTSVSGGLTELRYDAGLTHHVTGAVTIRFALGQDTKVDGTLTLVIGGAVAETYGATTRTIDGDYEVKVDGTYSLWTPEHTLHVPQVGLNFSTLSRLSPLQFEWDPLKHSMSGKHFAVGGSKKSYVGVSASAFGLKVSLSGVSKSSSKASAKIAAVYVEGQIIKIGIRVLELDLGAHVHV